jgi:hypothetical protein
MIHQTIRIEFQEDIGCFFAVYPWDKEANAMDSQAHEIECRTRKWKLN